MITSTVNGSLDALLERLRQFRNPDLGPLARDVADAIVDGNREGLMSGTDADGADMAELAESTIRRGRGGYGPPTIPRFRGSQLIDRFRAKVEPDGIYGFRVTAGWDGVPQVRFFATGTRNMPRRNPVGIRPATRAKIRDLVNQFARKLTTRF